MPFFILLFLQCLFLIAFQISFGFASEKTASKDPNQEMQRFITSMEEKDKKLWKDGEEALKKVFDKFAPNIETSIDPNIDLGHLIQKMYDSKNIRYSLKFGPKNYRLNYIKDIFLSTSSQTPRENPWERGVARVDCTGFVNFLSNTRTKTPIAEWPTVTIFYKNVMKIMKKYQQGRLAWKCIYQPIHRFEDIRPYDILIQLKKDEYGQKMGKHTGYIQSIKGKNIYYAHAAGTRVGLKINDKESRLYRDYKKYPNWDHSERLFYAYRINLNFLESFYDFLQKTDPTLLNNLQNSTFRNKYYSLMDNFCQQTREKTSSDK